MPPETAIDLGRSAVLLAATLAAPLLVAAVVVSLLTSILQTVTQIQDTTLSLAPRLLVIVLLTLMLLPWSMSQLAAFSTDLFIEIPQTIRGESP